MKKSFLKRVMAAAVAVPVALTQTVMFASFAESKEGTFDGTTIDMNTLTNVLCDTEKNKPVEDISSYKAKEAGNANAIVQEGKWNEDLNAALTAMLDTEFNIDTASLAESISTSNRYANAIKKILKSEGTTAKGVIGTDKVVVTINVDYDYGKEISDRAADTLAKDYPDVDLTVDVKGTVTGTITITADTSELVGNKKISAEAVIDVEGFDKAMDTADAAVDYVNKKLDGIRTDLKKAATEKVDEYRADVAEAQAKKDQYQAELSDLVAQGASGAEIAEKQAELNDAQAELDDATKKLNDAEKIAYEKIDEIVDKYQKWADKGEDYAQKAGKTYDKEITATDADDLWEQARNFALRKAPNKGQKIPESIAAAQATNTYRAASDVMANVIAQINATANTKGYDIAVTLDDVVTTAKTVYDISAHVTADDYKYTVDGMGYIEDTDFDKAVYVAYFNAQLEEQGLEVVEDSIEHVKVIEADGAADANALTAEGTLNIYRVVWYTDTKVIETTETETETDTADTTPTESDTADTTPTESDTADTTPTESDTADTDSTEPDTQGRTDVKVTINTEATAHGGFYFSHDPRAFSADTLIDAATVKEVDEDGKETEVEADMSKFSFKFYKTTVLDEAQAAEEAVSPQSAYADSNLNPLKTYVAQSLYIYYEDQLVANAQVPIYIGVKGDANLDGVANSSDAARVLIYAAEIGAENEDAVLFTDGNTDLERFAYFLADTSGESIDHGATTSYDADQKSPLNSSDAAQILIYAAIAGANDGKCDWIPEVLKKAPYPTYSEEIAKAAGLMK